MLELLNQLDGFQPSNDIKVSTSEAARNKQGAEALTIVVSLGSVGNSSIQVFFKARI